MNFSIGSITYLGVREAMAVGRWGDGGTMARSEVGAP